MIDALALAALGEAVVVTRPDGTIVRWNRAAEVLFGRAASEVLGENLVDAMPATSLDQAGQVLAGLASGQPWSGELLVARVDGSVLRVRLTVSPVTDPDGALAGFALAACPLDASAELGPSAPADAVLALARDSELLSRHAPDGTLLWVSPSCRGLLGYEPEELVGSSVYELFHPDDLAALRQIRDVAAPERAALSLLEFRLRRRDGEHIWVETSVHGVRRDGADEPAEYVCVSHDVTGRREVDEHAPVGIATLNPHGRVIHANEALAAFLGRDASEVVGRTLEDLAHPADATSAQWDRIEMRFLRPDGQVAWGLVSRWLVADSAGNPHHVVCHIVDVTDRKRYEDEIEHRELYDPQTGLATRVLFADRLEHALTRLARWPASLAVLHVDIDDFKSVNDSFGYAAGDRVLAAVAERLSDVVRAVDTLARTTTLGRFGGDVFVVLCEGLADEASALSVAERIQHAFTAPFTLGETEFLLAASIGIATTSDPHHAADDLAREAHIAAHRAKERGGAGFEVFDVELHRRGLARLEIEAALKRALERDELLLYYQPTIELATGRVVGVEALVRWQHPERGLLLPEEFVPVAERTGLVVTLGRWVLDEACRQAAAWQRELGEELPVSVNLSSRHLGRAELTDEVLGALAAAGVRPSALCVEITETAVMQDLDRVLPGLRALAQLGVAFAIDDFGTGYSSFAQLGELPVDRIKIDQAFVRGLGRTPKHAALVSAMTEMAHALGLAVVAEGIETEDQLAQVRRLGCDVGQGFLLARPMRAAELLAFVERGRAGAKVTVSSTTKQT